MFGVRFGQKLMIGDPTNFNNQLYNVSHFQTDQFNVQVAISTSMEHAKH